MPSFKSSLVTFASVVQVVAHGHVDWLHTNGVAFRGYSAPEMSWNPNHPPVVGWTNGATDNGYVEPNSFSDADIICHRGARPGKGHVTVAAGDKITLQWNTWPESHKGPVIDYLARCPGNCETVDKNDLEFFKISAQGLIDMSMHSGKWAADVLVSNDFSWTVQIPADLAPGNYVLRHEIIALHGSGQPNGAQSYPQCFNLKVTGDGDLAPAGVKGTQLYKADDPGILFNLYTTPLSYKIPGPTQVPGLPSTVSQLKVQAHPGSTAEEIHNEPDWAAGHQHRVGFRDRNNRLPGITHKDDEHREDVALEKQNHLAIQQKAMSGELVNFRDLIEKQEDFHLRYPQNRSLGWRYVLNATEDWVKNKEQWPANLKKEQDEEKREQDEKKKEEEGGQKPDSNQQEHEWNRPSDKSKHHDAYAKNNKNNEDQDKSTNGDQKKPKLSDNYSPAEIALLRALEYEKDYITQLKENDGNGISPQHKNMTQISIDEQDQFSPDNWLPRSSDLIRLTGKHPLNAEPPLSRLYDAGLITPNELHYVRNHGPVPRILWEFHELEITYNGNTQKLSMDKLKKFATINIAVALACDGNRRKELNMIKKSKGFSWGAGATSCAYWKGPLLRDVLLAHGVPETPPSLGSVRYWVNFEGADDLSEGKYSTCIPFEHAMSPNNDVILAYEMNDVFLPPDHGYPVRVIIPGYVGGRNVKWLKKIWISDKENDSYYHIWDNRVLPSFVTEKDGPFAEALFRHPDTACNEQNLNSVIVKPAQGEKIPLSNVKNGGNYRIEGYAYDGGGHQVQRVEVSLDDGETWLYCIRKFPDYPIHTPAILFRHPVEPATKTGGWMKPSVENQMAEVKQQAGAPQKEFTREEIEKHNTQDDCWLVVDGKVYDATSVLDWHPGGAAAIIGHGGKVHQETSDEFASIHDEYAYKKLKAPGEDQEVNGNKKALRDGDGTFELTVKTYFPDENQPGGALSNILDCMPIGEEVELRGPTGEIIYNGNGNFTIENQERHFDHVSLVLGGSGITPGYSLLARILLSSGDKTKIRVVDANKTEADILLKDELDEFESTSNGQLKVTHVLSHAGEGWKGKTGHVNEDIIKESLFGPSEKSAVFLCGPPAMIQKAALPVLKDWGFVEDENMFGF
ncbi:nitrate reductase NADH [Fusarium acuminatum]|uniref:Nitrate reductase [NADPH] n=1 Tax=Fusarium acuminatum TaxID=5515 RepID=A0ABZ2X3Q6_9HYPO